MSMPQLMMSLCLRADCPMLQRWRSRCISWQKQERSVVMVMWQEQHHAMLLVFQTPQHNSKSSQVPMIA